MSSFRCWYLGRIYKFHKKPKENEIAICGCGRKVKFMKSEGWFHIPDSS